MNGNYPVIITQLSSVRIGQISLKTAFGDILIGVIDLSGSPACYSNIPTTRIHRVSSLPRFCSPCICGPDTAATMQNGHCLCTRVFRPPFSNRLVPSSRQIILSRQAIAVRLQSLPKRPLHSQEFSPLRPPNPAELPKPRPRKRRKWLRRALYFTAFYVAAWQLDVHYNCSAITRSFRTFYTGLVIGIDYKINFRAHPPLANSIEELHARNATRVFELLRENGGLYLKIGQAIAMQSAILPPQFQKMFARMFDDAPQNEWKEVEKVVRQDFGKSVEDVFGVSFGGDQSKGVMERTARASASVAQVHWARLQDGREVAVKVQKKEIATQVGWDLWSFKYVQDLRGSSETGLLMSKTESLQTYTAGGLISRSRSWCPSYQNV